MNPSELTIAAATLAVIISDLIPNDDEFTLFAIAINQFGDNIDAIVAQRALIASAQGNKEKELDLELEQELARGRR
jgi:hypothetical protein